MAYWKCQACGFEAQNEGHKQDHMRKTATDPKHAKSSPTTGGQPWGSKNPTTFNPPQGGKEPTTGGQPWGSKNPTTFNPPQGGKERQKP